MTDLILFLLTRVIPTAVGSLLAYCAVNFLFVEPEPFVFVVTFVVWVVVWALIDYKGG